MPALKPKPYSRDEKDVYIKELPEWMHAAFEGMEKLNRIQSRVSTRHCVSDIVHG